MTRLPLLVTLLIATALLPACTAGPRSAGNTPGAAAAAGPEVALTVRPASFTPVEGWRTVEAQDPGTGLIYVSDQALLTETNVLDASVIDNDQGEPALRLDFDDQGARRLYDHSDAHLNQPVAFFIDHELVSVPVITATMARSAVIHGSLDRYEAERVATALAR